MSIVKVHCHLYTSLVPPMFTPTYSFTTDKFVDIIILSSKDVASVSVSLSESPSRRTRHLELAAFSPTRYRRQLSTHGLARRAYNAPIRPKNFSISRLLAVLRPLVSSTSKTGRRDSGYVSRKKRCKRTNAVWSSAPHSPESESVHFLSAILTDSTSTAGNFAETCTSSDHR
jgi:hypothetical protein